MKSTTRLFSTQLAALAALGGTVLACGGVAEENTAKAAPPVPPPAASAPAAAPAPVQKAQEQAAQKPAPKPAAKPQKPADAKKKKEDPGVSRSQGGKAWTPPKVSTADLSSLPSDLSGAAPKHEPHPTTKNLKNPPFEKREIGKVRLVCEEGADTFDFGKLSQGESPSHTFTLKVEGEDDLVVKRVKASCGCTVARTEIISPTGERREWKQDEAIAPGSTLEVNATLKTENKRGQVSTNVAIYSNDDEFAVRRLTLRARVQALIEVSPPSFNFGQITPFDEAEGVVSLTSTADQPFSVELLDQQTLRDELRVELVPVEPGPDGRATQWEARLALGPDLSEGIKNYPLRFKTDLPIDAAEPGEDGEKPTHEYRAYAMAQVQGLIFTTPNYSAFGMMRPGEVQARTFRIHTRDPEFEFPEDPPVELQGFKGEFELPDNVEVAVRRAPDKKSLEVDIKVFDLPEDFEGSFSGFVEVVIGHPTKEKVRSRFSGIARPGVQTPAGTADSGE